ncbi:hypothetical protein [Streptomyces rapamycinicus]|uniref:Uncharacterized protein n=2 Tax=Streptomyces rapamycinicus TaxID=1226757 RepID=A0A0A0NP72_STRRN|nr:hypothetical protein [Streptomyces rapamycinicus]AGP56180.1 hypothetical protein M271_23335 [Streptomyces rapamycinicus NRRL 5491]MBB4783787.1 MoxR-like ATPase [Streptomyces rapamycinicus]RLV80741.1 hypothetical protein D3C57_120190 [Streptomyces rapamycinicus NRRL 5491]UTO64144.1 hypothetical protein LJB45_18630 [Streptomyces rapamycinicus]UTP32099.1 hypothetical protein LIV37_23750 [Streptomyces rapamycinicus NRRL 5491]
MSDVENATRSEVDQLGVGPVAPGLTAAAVALARQLDDAEDAKGAAAAARELRAIMSDLRKLAPVESKGDAVDDVSRKRAERRAALQQQAGG